MYQTTVRCAILSLAVVFSAAMPADAQEQLSWAEKLFEKRSHDFGVVARASDVSYRFKITNIYKEPVHIAHVRTTCGCTAGNPSTDTLQSRQVGYIEVTMDTLKFTRRKDSNLVVVFDRPLYAEVRIPITAYIRTDVVLSPGSANFGPIENGSGAERKISITYAGRDDWTIREVQSKNEHIEAAVVETSRGGGRATYDLLVKLKPTAPVGPLRDQVVLVTDDQNSPYVPVLVEARVEADITVTPQVVSLGNLVPGRPKTVNVVLRGRKPFEIAKVECESQSGRFQVRLPKEARPVHVLPLTISPPETPGTFDEKFTVTIVGRPEPITFRAFGKVDGAAARTEGGGALN